MLVIDEAHGLSPSVLEEIRLMSNFESDSAKQLQIVLTGQPELRDVLNQPELRQLKQRVALRCEIKAFPNIEETTQYIASRLKVAGAQRSEIFSPGAVDYIFRCSEGIPRNINNLCDNALLNGFATGEAIISRAIVEEVAGTFDMLPRADRFAQNGDDHEAPVRIFNAAGRAELWAAGNGDTVPKPVPAPEPSILINEYSRRTGHTATIDELGSAFGRSGLGRGNNGQSL